MLAWKLGAVTGIFFFKQLQIFGVLCSCIQTPKSADSYPVAIYGFQSESGLDKVERAGSYGKRPKKNSLFALRPFR